jgi:hypothetical protein
LRVTRDVDGFGNFVADVRLQVLVNPRESEGVPWYHMGMMTVTGKDSL